MNREGTGRLLDAYIKRLMLEGRPERPIWNREQAGEGYNWSYVNALFMNALLRLRQKTGNPEYLAFVDAFMGAYVAPSGEIRSYRLEDYNIDHICGGTVLLDLYGLTKKEKYKRAARLLMRQLGEHPRTEEGSFWHKKIYPGQVWLDGLYMAQPFYMRYGAEEGDLSICRDSYRQFLIVESRMKDRDSGLYYHGYDSSRSAFWCDKETGLSENFWLRSIGWFAMACVDVMEVMPRKMEEEKGRIRNILKEAVDAVLVYLDPDRNMWYQVPNQQKREGNYLETSGSAMISYALLKGNRLQYLDDSYRIYGEKIFDGISAEKLQEKDGWPQLGGICLAAGLGGKDLRRDGSFAYYISEPVVENDGKGVGPFLLAYTER